MSNTPDMTGAATGITNQRQLFERIGYRAYLLLQKGDDAELAEPHSGRTTGPSHLCRDQPG